MTDIDEMTDSELATAIRGTDAFALASVAKNISGDVEQIRNSGAYQELNALVAENTKGATEDNVEEVSDSLVTLLNGISEADTQRVVNESLDEMVKK
jgi:hypothetical protein